MPASSFQALFSQFQARYPVGCLSAELLTIHHEQYVVRAVVQIANTTVATAMAAAPELETAEDRAKLRVLESLIAPSAVPPSLMLSSPPDRLPAADAMPQPAPARSAYRPEHLVPTETGAFTEPPFDPTALALEPESTDLTPAAALSVLPVPPSVVAVNSQFSQLNPPNQPSWEAEFQSMSQPASQVNAGQHGSAMATAVPVELSAVNVAPSSLRTSKTERASKRIAESSADSGAPVGPVGPGLEATKSAIPEPADRSEEIMRIGIEMKRLGWSTEQGREYLKRTYGKASRSKLDDAELLDFLRYLEIQSSPLQTPF